MVCVQIGLDGCHRPAQFFPILAVAGIAVGAEPLVRVGLQGGRARADDFPPLAPGVTWGTERAQAPMGSRQLWRLGQGALAGGLAREIHIEDEPACASSIPQPTYLPLFVQWASQQIF